MYNLFLKCKDNLKDVDCIGFLDDKHDALNGYDGYPPIISSVESYTVKKNDVFVCALGDVKYKRKYVEMMLAKGGKFISLIHPDVQVGMNTKIGDGCIVRSECHIDCDISIGRFVTIMGYSVLGHDCCVRDWSHLGAYTFLGGFSEINEMVTLHPGTCVLPHKKIGNRSVVGAGSVILKNVEPEVTIFGIPAKTIGLKIDTVTFINAFAEVLEIEDASGLNIDTEFRALNEWNSLGYLNIIAMLEEKYGVKIEHPEFKKFATIGDIVTFIESNK